MDDLEALKAARKEREIKAEAEEKQRALDQALEDERQIAELQPKNRGSKVVETPVGLVLIKKPSNTEYERLMDSEVTTLDQVTFLKSCVLYPVDFNKFVDEYPGTIQAISNAAMKLAGFEKPKK